MKLDDKALEAALKAVANEMPGRVGSPESLANPVRQQEWEKWRDGAANKYATAAITAYLTAIDGKTEWRPNQGKATWKYDPEVDCWYFSITERNPPPYRKQIETSCIVDIDSTGRVAGVEIIEHIGGPPLPAPPRAEK